ncbi:dephospho-CoA kinase [Ravibacter arvi]|uniref:Dephospho-CoA kinase n=1 Tax=Ravibacter arvi TaxID=2051041 RepID=A0ABP8LXK6_9BACT
MGKVVGVTGGIGSGKSTVCRLFMTLGIPVYEADARARWLTEHDPEIRKEIVALLGAGAYRHDGSYDTGFVSSKVFPDKGLLTELNSIVHPRVRLDTLKWVEARQDAPYVIKEAAIMGKAGPGTGIDFVVAVLSPVELRKKRVLSRDIHRTEAQFDAILANQASDSQLLEIADFVVRNDEKAMLIPQVLQIHERLVGAGIETGGF